MKMKYGLSVAMIVVLVPALAVSGFPQRGRDVAKVCKEALADGTVKASVADPNNCSSYYKCSKWFKRKLTCKNGQHFSAITNECVDPCEAGCDPTVVCTTTEASTTEVLTTEPEVPATEPEVPATEPEAPATEPEAPAAAPEDSAAEPEDSAAEAEDSAAEAEDSAAEAEDSAAEAEAPAAEAEAPAAVPEAPTAAPEAFAAAPEDPATEPAAPAGAPEAHEDSAGAPEAQEDSAAEAEATQVEEGTTEPFWKAIVARFSKPPANIPGFDGTIPTNY